MKKRLNAYEKGLQATIEIDVHRLRRDAEFEHNLYGKHLGNETSPSEQEYIRGRRDALAKIVAALEPVVAELNEIINAPRE